MTGWKLHRRRCHDNTGKERNHRGCDLEAAVDFEQFEVIKEEFRPQNEKDTQTLLTDI